ncbi:hypothetical protein [Nitriliruptor alkaliphilus]|uniref:hypothetical protein n=1 Tax=Nitriliruptor alkaliphilus TaxID=427918 RepID=UPI000696C0F5|nr:hypothetical protein [Nitriliruptor alkaliphilus]
MPEEPRTDGPSRSRRLDRVDPPDLRTPRPRDVAGKEALYSTAPSAAPSSQVQVLCRRCDVESGISIVAFAKLLRPPVLWNPLTRKLWARCPTCGRRAWLRVRQGQALRALLDRTPLR